MAGVNSGIGAGVLPVPIPPPVAMAPATSSINNFKRGALTQLSPYGQDCYSPMYQFWSGDGPQTPAQLSTEAVSSRVQWFLAFHHSIQSYVVLHDPLIYPAAPGLNYLRSNQTIWVINDIGATSTTLSLVDQPVNLFYLVTAPVLPTDADFTTLMSTAALGASEVVPLADPAAAGWLPSASTPHCCHPLPHKLVVRALTLVQGRRADHKMMWEGLLIRTSLPSQMKQWPIAPCWTCSKLPHCGVLPLPVKRLTVWQRPSYPFWPPLSMIPLGSRPTKSGRRDSRAWFQSRARQHNWPGCNRVNSHLCRHKLQQSPGLNP
jgi:hypothetical protein